MECPTNYGRIVRQFTTGAQEILRAAILGDEMKVDLSNVTINTQTIIEKNFGTLNISSSGQVPDDKKPELREKIQEIRAELQDLKDVDPAYAKALGEVDSAIEELDGVGQPNAKSIVDRLKSAAEALGSAGKAASSAKTLIILLGDAATWIASVLL